MLGGMLYNLLSLVSSLIGIYQMIVVAAALISWVNPDPYNPIVRFLHQVTDPLLQPIRKTMSRIIPTSGLDFSPIILIFALVFLQGLIQQLMVALR